MSSTSIKLITKRKAIKFIPFCVFLVSILSVRNFVTSNRELFVNSTTTWWIAQLFVLYIYWQSKRYFYREEKDNNMSYISYYILWNLFEIFRGIFLANNYWDWKGLIGNSFSLLIPIVSYTSSNSFLIQKIFKYYFKYLLPLFLIIHFFISKDAYGFYLVPVSSILLLFPILPFRWKIMLFSVTILVFLADFGARSNIIKFIVPFILSTLYIFRNIISRTFFKICRYFLLALPIIFFTLAVNGVFNIFQIEKYISGNHVEIKKNFDGQIIEDNLIADTRTFLYVEVLQTAIKYNTWIIGRSAARGNDTVAFESSLTTNSQKERLGNEVAILNIFTWTGLIGIGFFFFIFYKSSYLSIYKSNNIFIKIIGIYISFRWSYAWVEDINNFSLTIFFLWIMIGMCFSKSFREMNDCEMRNWTLSIFDRRYRNRLKRKEYAETSLG